MEGVKSRDSLCLENLKLVSFVLRMYIHPQHDIYEDCFQEGCIGLLKAARGFDESKGFKFSTYAIPNIIGQIRQFLRDKHSVVRIPRDVLNLRSQIVKYAEEVGVGCLEVSDIMRMLKIPTYEAQEVLNSFSISYLGEPAIIGKDGETITLEETLPDKNGEDDIESFITEEIFSKTLDATIDRIPEGVSKEVFLEYIYDLIYGEKVNQRYFAEKFDVSQTQISRWIKKYIGMLKKEYEMRGKIIA